MHQDIFIKSKQDMVGMACGRRKQAHQKNIVAEQHQSHHQSEHINVETADP